MKEFRVKGVNLDTGSLRDENIVAESEADAREKCKAMRIGVESIEECDPAKQPASVMGTMKRAASAAWLSVTTPTQPKVQAPKDRTAEGVQIVVARLDTNHSVMTIALGVLLGWVLILLTTTCCAVAGPLGYLIRLIEK